MNLYWRMQGGAVVVHNHSNMAKSLKTVEWKIEQIEMYNLMDENENEYGKKCKKRSI